VVTPLGPITEAPPNGLIESRLLIKVPPAGLSGASTPVRLEVRANDALVQTIESSLLGPVPIRPSRKEGRE
jgi:hypothetical protein